MRIPTGTLVAFLLLFRTAGAADTDPFASDAPRMPVAWKVTERFEAPMDQAAAIAKRLGANLERLVNVRLDAGGIPLGVNFAHCATEDDAKALFVKFIEVHGGDPLYGVRRGVDVSEIVCKSRAVAAKARDVLGWDEPQTVTWKVSVDLVPLARSDDSKWNILFNLLSASKANPAGADAAAISEVAKSFEFGDALELPAGPEYVLTPAEEAADRQEEGGRLRVRLRRTEEDHGLPFVKVDARIAVRAFAPTPAAGKPDLHALVAPTAAWPAADAELKGIAAEVLKGADEDPPRRRVERILAAVNARVQFGGEVVGSRYGVKQTLAQGHGRCWDKSDLLVTLCRAAGIPTRQVGGWVRGVEGHVWAQVLLEGEGWLDVDATTTWLGVSGDYVPLWISEDGRIPIVYRGAPSIETAGD